MRRSAITASYTYRRTLGDTKTYSNHEQRIVRLKGPLGPLQVRRPLKPIAVDQRAPRLRLEMKTSFAIAVFSVFECALAENRGIPRRRITKQSSEEPGGGGRGSGKSAEATRVFGFAINQPLGIPAGERESR